MVALAEPESNLCTSLTCSGANSTVSSIQDWSAKSEDSASEPVEAASENTPCGSSLTSGEASGRLLRCFERDSPGSRPLPSHSKGFSIIVEGLKVLAGRAGGAERGADWAASAAVSPPYLERDSPGNTKGTGALSPRS